MGGGKKGGMVSTKNNLTNKTKNDERKKRKRTNAYVSRPVQQSPACSNSSDHFEVIPAGYSTIISKFVKRHGYHNRVK